MASSLFGGAGGGITSRIGALRQMVGGDPDAAMEHMMRTNPQFAEFVNANRGKTPEQICSDYGLDIGPLRRFMQAPSGGGTWRS